MRTRKFRRSVFTCISLVLILGCAELVVNGQGVYRPQPPVQPRPVPPHTGGGLNTNTNLSTNTTTTGTVTTNVTVDTSSVGPGPSPGEGALDGGTDGSPSPTPPTREMTLPSPTRTVENSSRTAFDSSPTDSPTPIEAEDSGSNVYGYLILIGVVGGIVLLVSKRGKR